MRAANNPFGAAEEGDKHYKALVTKASKYWKFQEKQIGADSQHFSDEYRQLVEAMMDADPAARPSAEQCLACPWMTGEIASAEDVAKVMASVLEERESGLASKAEIY